MKICGFVDKQVVAAGVLLCCIALSGILLWQKVVAVAPASTSVSRQVPIYAVDTQGEKLVALGLNCAWTDADCDEILAALEQYQIPATFFFVGDFVDAYPQAVQKIAQAGHELGNHSDTHADFTTLTAEQIQKEITDCNQKIEAVTGISPKLVRCPSGAYNDLAIATIWESGCIPIQWSLDSLDWKGTTAEEMSERILPHLKGGDILLFHTDTKHTAPALPLLIEQMQTQGYTFVTVGELVQKPKQEFVDKNSGILSSGNE